MSDIDRQEGKLLKEKPRSWNDIKARNSMIINS